MKRIVLIFASLIGLLAGAGAHPATHLEGVWVLDENISNQLGASGSLFEGSDQKPAVISFEKNDSVLKLVDPKLKRTLDDASWKILLAGKLVIARRGSERSFVLHEMEGMSVLRTLPGEKLSGQVFEVALVRGRDRKDDLLFLSESGEERAATAFQRVFMSEIDISVPSANGAVVAIGEIVINLSKAGEISIEGKRMKPAELDELLAEVAQADKDSAVILRGDRETGFDDIVKVLNQCQKAGIWNIAFSTAKKMIEKKEGALERTLPEKKAGTPMVISISKDGSLELDDEAVDLAELEAGLKAQRKVDENVSVTIKADDGGKSQRFVDVINLLAKLGFANITMAGFRE